MNKKIMYIAALVALVQMGKAQVTEFYQNDIFDALNAYDGNFGASGTARYIGMGESMGALGGDLSAVETNPAGLGVFRNSVANFSLGVLSNKNKTAGLGAYSTTDTKVATNAGVALALGNESDPLKINLGINYSYQPLDNSVVFGRNDNITYDYPNSNKVDQPNVFNGFEQYMNGYKSKLKLSVATNYNDVLYFGLGLDWHYLDMDRSVYYTQKNTVNGEVLSFNQQLTPYSQQADAFGLTVGVIGKITPELRLGAAYHSPIWWSNIDYSFNVFKTDENNDIYNNYIFFDQYKNTAPGKVVLSGAFASNIINEDNSLGVNFDFINYFNKDTEFKGDFDYAKNNSFVSNYMQDSQEYRAGIEYRFKELKLRAGYGYASSPIKDKSIQGISAIDNSTIQPKGYLAGEKNKFSLGAGYDLGQLFVDFAYQYMQTKYYTNFAGDYFNSGANASFSFDQDYLGKIKNTQNNFILTLGLRF